ncbi:MAG: hypothetical protein OXQ90_06300 [Gammaproteobacteria bacterium]|nr:hypothetical protein [Gammaproteobacteria bacterium]
MAELERIRDPQGNLTDRIRQVFREELLGMQDSWLVATGGLLLALLGIAITVSTSSVAKSVLSQYGTIIGPALVIVALVMVSRALRRPKGPTD